MRPKYDMFWKGLMEELMADLLLFIEPEIGKELDKGRNFEFLGKELAEMFPRLKGCQRPGSLTNW